MVDWVSAGNSIGVAIGCAGADNESGAR